MGTANVCDKELLGTRRASCIIEVDDVNSPTGVWWGEVLEMTLSNDTNLSVMAMIAGGRFLLKGQKPVMSDEEHGKVPTVNYRVYPNTETTRTLFEKLAIAKDETREAQRQANHWRNTHLETMAHLVSKRLIEEGDEKQKAQ